MSHRYLVCNQFGQYAERHCQRLCGRQLSQLTKRGRRNSHLERAGTCRELFDGSSWRECVEGRLETPGQQLHRPLNAHRVGLFRYALSHFPQQGLDRHPFCLGVSQHELNSRSYTNVTDLLGAVALRVHRRTQNDSQKQASGSYHPAPSSHEVEHRGHGVFTTMTDPGFPKSLSLAFAARGSAIHFLPSTTNAYS